MATVQLDAVLVASSGLAADLSITGVEQAATDTTDYANGRTRRGSAQNHTLYPITPLPAHLQAAPMRVMAQQLPQPVLVDGKPA